MGSHSVLGAVVGLLRGAAALSAATCLIWLLGSMGLGLLYDVPDPVTQAARSFDLDAAAGSPTFQVQPADEFWSFLDHGHGFNESDGSAPGRFAQYSFAPYVSVYEPSLLQRAAYVGLKCLLSLGVAWVWWILAAVVASGRADDPFTERNARRLRALGTVLLVGGPAFAVMMWLVHRWLLGSSELAADASVAALSWRDLPWWSVGAGLAVLALASVWRRGVAMRHELAGLV